MLFNSFSFALFLPVVFCLYWFVFSKKLFGQNFLLLVASYFFYACWDWRFLFLLIFSTLLDYYSGLFIKSSKEKRKKIFWLTLSIVINLGFLGVFKYYNFFAQSFSEAVSLLGFQINTGTLEVILPVGISFYTFHGLSYIIDIYYDKISAEKNFVDYALFVSFFPLLVAGPIERATHLLPQLKKERAFKYSNAVDGCRQILWGLFKKIVIADNCAVIVNDIFGNYNHYAGSTLAFGAVLFAVQIYCDFSGYTDIAIGTAKLFGIDLLRNFAFPYFSRDIAEFWRRWHISLSTWFRDYLYIPLGGSRGGTWMKIRNIFIIFLVSGFWHGANWTFITWGFLNALYIMPSIVMKTNRSNLDIVAQGAFLPTLKEIFQMLLTFGVTCFAWIFFRAENVKQAFSYISNIFSSSLFQIKGAEFLNGQISIYTLIVLITIFFFIEWSGRENKYAIEKLFFGKHFILRWSFYYTVILCMFLNAGKAVSFIYFQF